MSAWKNDRRRGVEHPLIHQVVLGLLLREGVEPAPRAERAQKPETVGRVHVVALAADADQADRARRMLRADLTELRGDLGDRGVPADALEAAVGAPAQRMLETLCMVHVEGNADGLVADVTAS